MDANGWYDKGHTQLHRSVETPQYKNKRVYLTDTMVRGTWFQLYKSRAYSWKGRNMVTHLDSVDALGSFHKCRDDLVLLHCLGREMLLHGQDKLISRRIRAHVRQLKMAAVLAQCTRVQFVEIHPL